MKTFDFTTNYGVAVNWLGNSYVLCNNIAEKDLSLYDNARFSPYHLEDNDGNVYEDENDVPDGKETFEVDHEIYQWFITDCTTEQVEYLEEHFGLLFTYSDLLDCYILCVDHYGTNWYYVSCGTDLESAQRKQGERK